VKLFCGLCIKNSSQFGNTILQACTSGPYYKTFLRSFSIPRKLYSTVHLDPILLMFTTVNYVKKHFQMISSLSQMLWIHSCHNSYQFIPLSAQIFRRLLVFNGFKIVLIMFYRIGSISNFFVKPGQKFFKEKLQSFQIRAFHPGPNVTKLYTTVIYKQSNITIVQSLIIFGSVRLSPVKTCAHAAGVAQ
jgi:hypothetical protein